MLRLMSADNVGDVVGEEDRPSIKSMEVSRIGLFLRLRVW